MCVGVDILIARNIAMIAILHLLLQALAAPPQRKESSPAFRRPSHLLEAQWYRRLAEAGERERRAGE